MQPKTINLRLNLEQVQHIVDGLLIRREDIEEDKLRLYDSLMADIFEELDRQGVHIDLTEVEE